MRINRTSIGALAVCGLGLLLTTTASAGDQWAGQDFLSDYGKLQPVAGKAGKDYAYVAPDADKIAGRYVKVMVDQPEVFISPSSPYKGTQPEDIAAIAGTVRTTAAAALQQRGYTIVEEAGPDTVYVKLAVTDLQIQKKKRGLLAYTPVGFVVNAGVQALKGFMEKYDLLDMSLQAEVQDSTTQAVLASAVLQRGKSADAKKPIGFDAVVTTTNEFGERFACRLDNARVQVEQRIDCTDAEARKARPIVVGR